MEKSSLKGHHSVLHCFTYKQFQSGYRDTCMLLNPPIDDKGRSQAPPPKRALLKFGQTVVAFSSHAIHQCQHACGLISTRLPPYCKTRPWNESDHSYQSDGGTGQFSLLHKRGPPQSFDLSLPNLLPHFHQRRPELLQDALNAQLSEASHTGAVFLPLLPGAKCENLPFSLPLLHGLYSLLVCRTDV